MNRRTNIICTRVLKPQVNWAWIDSHCFSSHNLSWEVNSLYGDIRPQIIHVLGLSNVWFSALLDQLFSFQLIPHKFRFQTSPTMVSIFYFLETYSSYSTPNVNSRRGRFQLKVFFANLLNLSFCFNSLKSLNNRLYPLFHKSRNSCVGWALSVIVSHCCHTLLFLSLSYAFLFDRLQVVWFIFSVMCCYCGWSAALTLPSSSFSAS